jgi:hypothetical protein
MNVVILAREARLQNVSRGAKELFDIVNRECATAGEFRPRREGALAAQAGQRGLACARLEGWGRLEPFMLQTHARESVVAHACLRCAHHAGSRRGRAILAERTQVAQTQQGHGRTAGPPVVERRVPCYSPVIYRGGLCCTRNGCGRYGSPAGYALIPNAAGSSTETPARVRCAACQRSRQWGRPRRSRRGP